MPRTADIGLKIGLAIIFAFTLAIMALALLDLNAKAAGGTRATLTVYQVKRAGVTETLTASDLDGHKFQNNGYVFIEAANAFTNSVVTLTFVTPSTTTADLSVVIPANTSKFIGPFPTGVYNQRAGAGADKNYVYLNYAGVTTGTTSSLTVGAFRMTTY